MRKKVLLVALVMFGISSAACAYATSSGELIAARAVLGLGAAAIMPLSLSILPVLFTADERPKAIAIMASATSSCRHNRRKAEQRWPADRNAEVRTSSVTCSASAVESTSTMFHCGRAIASGIPGTPAPAPTSSTRRIARCGKCGTTASASSAPARSRAPLCEPSLTSWRADSRTTSLPSPLPSCSLLPTGRRLPLHMSEQVQAALVLGTATNLLVKPRHGLGVVVKDLRLRLDIVEAVVPADLLTQSGDSLLRICS